MPLPSLTQSQKDALLLDEFNLQTAEALNPLAATMGRCNASFWNLPDKRLTVVLNTDPDRTVAVFSANSILGTQVNSMLDALALPMYSARVPLVPGPWSLVLGRQIALDSSGFYSVIPLPPPPPLPPALLA